MFYIVEQIQALFVVIPSCKASQNLDFLSQFSLKIKNEWFHWPNALSDCATLSATCAVFLRKKLYIYKNINEFSFLFLHEGWTFYVHVTSVKASPKDLT